MTGTAKFEIKSGKIPPNLEQLACMYFERTDLSLPMVLGCVG